ncbi:MAG: RsmB/NOP family class I SAM-dependent RNA methyltransferase [Betaproteobacteria bacterium]|nr:RsmB/NOP family class I SAM-dependent RNA methyltransferase [Betaproteobacteria bacterium]
MSCSSFQFNHAAALMQAIMTFEGPADAVTSRYFREHPNLGAHDRAFVAETVFAVLRHSRLLEHVAGDRVPRHLVAAYLLKLRGLNRRELAPCLREGEMEWAARVKAASLADEPLAVQAELPDWVVERLRHWPDDEVLAFGRAMQTAAPLDLRVNTVRATRADVLAALEKEGIAASPTPYSPVGVRLADKRALARHPLFLEGHIEVQDEGSQLLAFLLAPKRHDRVVDFCAGAGGKTLALGALMHSQGHLYAFDVSEKRLSRFRPRLKRSGLSNVSAALISHENDARIKRLAGKIDRVLVDAPCSGLGTLRRNPDLKWRQSPHTLAELTARQAAILAAAARLLKPGGRLVYATCSILPEENDAQVDAFLAAHPEFVRRDAAEIFARARIPLDTGPYCRLGPHRHGTDGFFAAVLERTAGAPGDAPP